VALTFDDGPHPQWTPQLLDLLREQRVKATFCVVGTEVREHPELVARIVREGHTLCNHSWHHEMDLGSRPLDEIRANLRRTNEAIQRAVPGATVSYFRQPGGRWTPQVVQVATELGMTSIDWDVDTRDWAGDPASALVERVTSHTRAGSIVLLHDGGGDRAATIEACRSFLPALLSRFRLIALPVRPSP
jgi:peptidoglycan/xylan/chitin deacetylase (PgdA/CDA1 family)